MERELRRNQNHLIIIGTGVAALGVWSAIKIVMTFYTQREGIARLLSENELDEIVIALLFYIIMAFIIGIILITHLFIGFSARAEGMGKRSGFLYLVISVVQVLAYLYDIFMTLTTKFNPDMGDSVLDRAVTIMIDVTASITLIEMMIAASRVKKISRQLREQEVQSHAA